MGGILVVGIHPVGEAPVWGTNALTHDCSDKFPRLRGNGDERRHDPWRPTSLVRVGRFVRPVVRSRIKRLAWGECVARTRHQWIDCFGSDGPGDNPPHPPRWGRRHGWSKPQSRWTWRARARVMTRGPQSQGECVSALVPFGPHLVLRE